MKRYTVTYGLVISFRGVIQARNFNCKRTETVPKVEKRAELPCDLEMNIFETPRSKKLSTQARLLFVKVHYHSSNKSCVDKELRHIIRKGTLETLLENIKERHGRCTLYENVFGNRGLFLAVLSTMPDVSNEKTRFEK